MNHVDEVVFIPSKENSLSPWLNGAGLTRKIAIFPSGAGIHDFVWRLSVAEIESDSLYSHFAHTHRTQMLLSGDGLELTFPHKVCVLNKQYQMVDFSGEDTVSCHLLQGPCQVLNVMTQSNVGKSEMVVLHGSYHIKTSDHLQRVFYIAQGEYEFVMSAFESLTLRTGDALLIKANQVIFKSVTSSAAMIEITFH